MNATERGRRSDALYYDNISRRELCDMIAHLESDLAESKAENAKLREQMERLVTLLRVDCDIDASWDGLRRFWSIGLTEDGCLMRDRACKAEAENAKLRELVRDAWGDGHPDRSCEGCDIRDECHNDVERMRKDADEYMDAMGLSPVTKAAYHDARCDFLRMADERGWY